MTSFFSFFLTRFESFYEFDIFSQLEICSFIFYLILLTFLFVNYTFFFFFLELPLQSWGRRFCWDSLTNFDGGGEKIGSKAINALNQGTKETVAHKMKNWNDLR